MARSSTPVAPASPSHYPSPKAPPNYGRSQLDAWRITIPERHRFEATRRCGGLLNRAVEWVYRRYHGRRTGVDNRSAPQEKRPSSLGRGGKVRGPNSTVGDDRGVPGRDRVRPGEGSLLSGETSTREAAGRVV